MRNRSSIVVLLAALAGCFLVALCAAAAVGGYFLITNRTVLPGAFAPPASLNRIVLVGNDFNIYVADPKTGAAQAITKDGGDNQIYNFPTWSPDDSRLAFVGYALTNNNPTGSTLFTATATGEKLTPVFKTTENFPFYLYWSPDNRHLGFLANKDAQHIALNVANADQPDSKQELDTGSPFYWAWAPDGSRVFTHVGGTRADNSDARLALLDSRPQASPQPLQSLPGAFQAPQWTLDGTILFSTQDGSEMAIALSDAQGKAVKKLVSYQGRASFALAPGGTRVAYVITTPDTRLPTFGPVRVVSVAGGDPQVISSEPALAFQWSPDGKKLAFITVTAGGNQSNFEFRNTGAPLASTQPERFPPLVEPQQGQSRIQLNWQVWDSATAQTHLAASFSPTASFLDLLPYFDQYTNSSTFWSPDSRSLVYTARSTQTGGELWIADASGTTPPRKIGDALIAFWSWK